MTARSPVLALCRPCGHVWAAAWLPMEAMRACRAMRAPCPACGESKRLALASAHIAALWAQGPRDEPFFIDPAEGQSA